MAQRAPSSYALYCKEMSAAKAQAGCRVRQKSKETLTKQWLNDSWNLVCKQFSWVLHFGLTQGYCNCNTLAFKVEIAKESAA